MIFDFDSTFFVHLSLFVGILLIFSHYFAKPWLKLKERREERTTQRIRKAEQAYLEGVSINGECEAVIGEARRDALAERERVRYETRLDADARRMKADQDADRLLEESERAIMYNAWQTRRSMRGNIKELAEELSRQVIGRSR